MKLSTAVLLSAVILFIYFLSPFGIIVVDGSSMEPTISGDSIQLYVESQNASEGDIIIFESSQREGEFIIHRVQESTNQGYITIGDNNDRTDQATGEDIVTNTQIRGVAVELFDYPVHLPYVGGIIILASSFLIETGILLLLLLVIWSISQSAIQKKHNLSILSNEDIANPIFFIAFLTLTAAIIFGGSTVPVSIVHSEAGIEGQPYVVPLGDKTIEQQVRIDVSNRRGITTVKVDEKLLDVSHSSGQASITFFLEQRQETGAETIYIQVYNHPPLLPARLLQSLTNVSPIIPAFISSATAVLPIYILYRFVGNPRQRIKKPTNRRLNKLYNKYVD